MTKTKSEKKAEDAAAEEAAAEGQAEGAESTTVVFKEPQFVFNCTPEKERKPRSKKEINAMFRKFFEQSRTTRVSKAKKLTTRRNSRIKASSAMKKLMAADGNEVDYNALMQQIQSPAGGKPGAPVVEEEEEEEIEEGYDEDGNWIMKREDEMMQGQKESMLKFMRRKKIPATAYVMEWVVSLEEQSQARMGTIDWETSPVFEVKPTYTSLVRENLNKDFKCKARGGLAQEGEEDGEGGEGEEGE